MKHQQNRRLIAGLWLPATDPDYFSKHGTVDGYAAYQYDRLTTAMKYVKYRRTCVDGGAHVGSWSVHLSKLFKDVHAFEPMQHNFDCLIANTEKMPNVHRYMAALSSTVGTVNMSRQGGKSYAWHVKPAGTPHPCVSLDSLALEYVDLLKLDVEGHEFEALNGAIDLLHHCRPVVIIEEKLDPSLRASTFLKEQGMQQVAQIKWDKIFVWP